MTSSLPDPKHTEPSEAAQQFIRSVWIRFTGFFLVLVVVLLGVSLPVYLPYKTGVQDHILANEEVSVVAAVQMFQKEMYEQLHMLDLIVHSPALNQYLAQGTAEQHQHVEGLFTAIATSFHRFDQIRLLDNDGREKIRVNLIDGKGRPVAQNQLQNKADRYYFQATQQMQPGQIYISALDLNVENGVIEEPYKPMLRFSTPLRDAQGEQVGVLVINYLAKGMLVRFRQLMNQRVDQQGMLLDSQGYWLSNHERSNEWGADLGQPDHNFAQLFPDAWAAVSANASGVLETDQGVFRYQNVEPLNFLDSQPAHFRMEHHPLLTQESYANTQWKLVVFIPQELIDSHSFLNQPLGRVVSGLVIVLLAGLAFLAAYLSVQRRLRLDREHENRALLERHATIDALTGIRNRRSFYELGERALKQAQRTQEPLAALMVDADYFKKVNDTYGHAVGDLVLQELARVMTATVREEDVLGRIGGEEFAVLLRHMALDQALDVAERLRDQVEQLHVVVPEGDPIRFTVSLGVAMLSTAEHDLSDLFKKADIALYAAKQQGRNRVVHYTDEMGH